MNRSIRHPFVMMMITLLIFAATRGEIAWAQKKARNAEPPAIAKVTSGDWVGEGDGQPSDSPAGFIQKGKAALVVSNPVLGQTAYLIRGDIVLPPAATGRLHFSKDSVAAPKKITAENSSDATGANQPPPLPGIVLNRDKDGKTIRAGKQTWNCDETGDATVPLFLAVMQKMVAVNLGSLSENLTRQKDQHVEVVFSLTGGAKLQNLRVIPLPSSPYVPVFDAARLANAKVDGRDAKIGQIDPAALPQGLQTIQGVPFYFADAQRGGMDVAASMSGVKDPLKHKAGFMSSVSIGANGRLVASVPGDQYSALHLIAFSAGRAGHVPRTTVRVGIYGGSAAILEDAVVEVPTIRASGKSQTPDAIPVKLANGQTGALYHVRVPLAQTGNVKEFKRFDLEFTRDMNTHVNPPDPNEFGQIGAGMPSDVVVLAATLEPSPITMTYVAEEAGNVFSDQQKCAFRLTLTNRSAERVSVRAYAHAVGPGTGEEYGIERKEIQAEKTVELAPGKSREVTLDVTPKKRGWFKCTIASDVDGRQVQRRDTTFAVLAPDTRKALDDSPFGIWEFWHPHSVARQENQVEIIARLINKGGWRWTYGGSAAGRNDAPDIYDQMREKYKIRWNAMSLPDGYQRGAGVYDEEKFKEVIPDAIAKALKNVDPHFKVMHESRSSLDLLRRYSEFLGGKPYDMPAAEREKLEQQFENVKKYCLAIKKADPRAKVVLFNDYPAVVFQFLSRKFPAEAFDAIGLEGAMFLRQPERQPDWLSLLGHMHEMKRALAKYGYDKPIWTTEALYHPTESGALSLHDQAVISVREAMMALQLGVQRMAAAGILKDPSDDYHWSNWGSAGFCFRDPEINPKPAYATYAWLTQILDQAKPAGKIATPNSSLHVVDFVKADGSHVYAIWTAKGVQNATLRAIGKAKVYDAFGNLLPSTGGAITLGASPTPLYITDATIQEVTTAAPVEITRDPGKMLIDFDSPNSLQEVKGENKVLESNWDTPRFKGKFQTEFVTEDGASAMKVALQPDADERKLLPRYVEFKLAKPLELSGRPHEFTMRVKGNSGWGQIIFEVVDAKGRVWTSCGNQYAGASNAADPHGYSFISFEGWQTIHVPVVGMYPEQDQSIYWPHNYNWWPTNSPEEKQLAEQAKLMAEQFAVEMKAYPDLVKKYEADLRQWEADKTAAEQAKKKAPAAPKKPTEPKPRSPRNMGYAPVDYPLTLTKVIVTMRPHILYLDEERPVANPAIYLDKLGVTDPPPGM